MPLVLPAVLKNRLDRIRAVTDMAREEIAPMLDAPASAAERPGQTHLLPRSPRRLVLAFDGADVLLGTDQQDGFYGMLRGWAEATSSPGFDKLRILLAVSSAPDQLIRSLKQSPFNLTQPLAVDGLGLDQLAELSRA